MTFPKHAIVAVTYKCNGHCIMCNVWREHCQDEMGPELFGRLPPSLKTINITGGEPFLREDLGKVIYVLKGQCKNSRIVISTNGLEPELLRRHLKEIRRLEPSIGVRVSIDGLEEIHNSIRGVKGAFERAMESVDICRNMGIKDLGLAFTILQENKQQLKDIYHLSRKLRLQLAVSIAHNSQNYFRIDTIQPIYEKQVLFKQLEEIIAHQLKQFNVKDWFRAYFLYGLFCQSHGHGRIFNSECTAARDFFFMNPLGDVYLCPIVNVKLGNLCQTLFESIWDSSIAADARRFADDCPRHCWMSCTVTPFIKRHMPRTLIWIFSRKIAAHMGIKIINTSATAGYGSTSSPP